MNDRRELHGDDGSRRRRKDRRVVFFSLELELELELSL
jgi:hypothetical protein